MKVSNVIMILAIFSITVTSCNDHNEVSDSIDSSSEGNYGLTVSAPPQVNSFKINDFISIIVQNNTNHEISITQDGISLWIKNGNDWVEIKKSLDVRGRILSAKSNKDYSLTLLEILPEVINNNSPVIVRIYITGVDQLTGEKVQGYVDVNLSP
jgi:hypothetical protein